MLQNKKKNPTKNQWAGKKDMGTFIPLSVLMSRKKVAAFIGVMYYALNQIITYSTQHTHHNSMWNYANKVSLGTVSIYQMARCVRVPSDLQFFLCFSVVFDLLNE